MNLQSKAIFSITSVFIALAIGFTIILKTVLLGGFVTLERADVTDNVHRVKELLEHEQKSLTGLLSDWAIWDDAYTFVKDHNPQFIHSNLIASTYAANNIDVILFMNRRGRMVFGKEYDYKTKGLKDISPELLNHFTINSRFLRIRQEKDIITGLLTTSKNTYMIAVSPVLKSDDSGVSPGIMLMAKRINKHFIASLQRILRIDLHIYRNRELRDKQFQEVEHKVKIHNGIYEDIIDDNHVSGYGLVNDIFTKPALLYQVSMKRDIYQQGLKTNHYLIAVTLVMVIIISILIAALIRKLVVNKIATITRRLKQLESNYDSATQLQLQDLGHDEIGDLSQTINELLENFKRTATDLGNAREMAERNNQAKTEFLSQLSHELRTPLNSIIGFAQLTPVEKMDLTTRENIDQIVHAGTHLLGLIDDLLDQSKLELGKFDIGEECVNVQDLIDDCLSLVTPPAREHHISLTSDCSKGEPLFISVDYKRLKQVLVNLLSNAIKYNREGGYVRVTCQALEEDIIRIEVHDNGIGIAANTLELIFEPYERGNGKHLPVAGSGIGLALSRKLIQAMGGRIGVSSEEGKGSTFWLELNRF